MRDDMVDFWKVESWLYAKIDVDGTVGNARCQTSGIAIGDGIMVDVDFSSIGASFNLQQKIAETDFSINICALKGAVFRYMKETRFICSNALCTS